MASEQEACPRTLLSGGEAEEKTEGATGLYTQHSQDSLRRLHWNLCHINRFLIKKGSNINLAKKKKERPFQICRLKNNCKLLTCTLIWLCY